MATAGGGVKHETEGPPVDQMTTTVIHDGQKRQVPAISREHVGSNLCYWLYKPPSSIFSSPTDRLALISGDRSVTTKYETEISVYCQSMQYLLMDLNSVLQADYSKFWSHVIYDKDFLLTIDNYLRMAPRWFDSQLLSADNTLESMHEELHEMIFKLVMRMSTMRESKFDHMSLDAFRHNIETYVYDAPKILDLCSLFGFTQQSPGNPTLRKMLKSVLTKQPTLLEKLGNATKSFENSISTLKVVCDPSPDTQVATIAMCVAAMSLKTLDDEMLLSTCTAATETVVSLLQLVENCPNEVLEKFSVIIDLMPEFYESVFLPLMEEVERRQDCVITGFKNALESLLMSGMSCTLEVYRYYVEVLCMNKVADFLADSDAVEVVEKYIAIFMHALSDRMFLLAYNSLYPLKNDFNDLRKHPATHKYVNETHLSFIQSSLQQQEVETAADEENLYGKTVEYAQGAVGGVDDEKISSIQAIFPELGANFIEKCLDYYGDNVDEVVSAIMDNNLPPSLEKLMNEPVEEKKVREGEANAEVHIGKKNKLTQDILDDRAEKYTLRKVVLQHSEVCDEVVVQSNDKLYDDEYDDTYDSYDIGVPEKSSEDVENRPYETPRVLAGANERKKKHWEKDEESDEDDEEKTRKQREFCENPEIVRARREQRYQDKLASRGKQPPQTRDVVGNARGQGQSGDVLRNRNLKERHKGGNRKNQADRKRREF